MNIERKKMMAIVLVILLGVALIGGLSYSRYEERKQSEWISQLAKEASPYEQQRDELKKQILKKESSITQKEDNPIMVAAFYVETPQEARQALTWAEEYMEEESITFLLNPAIDSSINEKIIETITKLAKQPCEAAVYGSLKDENARIGSQLLAEQLETKQLAQSGYWFLSEDSVLKDYTDWLKDNGFVGYSLLTDYAIHINSGKSQSFYYMEYVPVKPVDHKIKSTLELCINENTVAVILFSMKDLNVLEETKREELAKSVFDIIEEKENQISIQTPKEVYEYLENQTKSEETRRAEYEAFKAEKEAEIKELEKQIDAIYSRWKG